jgi:hypothetical protein
MNKTLTPDFGVPGVVLYQWSQANTSLSPAPASGLGPPRKASDLSTELADLQTVKPGRPKNADATYSAIWLYASPQKVA